MYVSIFIFFLLFGSFLNVVGYRLIQDISIIQPRSFCPYCKTTLAWYDLIPLISWLMLRGSCRSCSHSISWLYPCIELLTACSFTALVAFFDPGYWIAYSIFFTALLVIIRTDAETMLISRFTTLAFIPVAYVLSYFNLLPITSTQSILGSLFGYILLWSIARLFYLIKNKQGMGEGDFDLLAFIGAFTGIAGAWVSLFIGSILGSCWGIYLLWLGYKPENTHIAFGPWLCLGALLYSLYLHKLIFFIF